MDVNYYYHDCTGKPMSARSFNFSRGFTLVELVIAVAIAAILLAAALPSFAELFGDTRLIANVNTMDATLQYARSEAIKRSDDVVICKGTPENGCDNSREWQDGWIVFVDDDRNRQWEAGTEPLLHAEQALSHGDTLTLHAFPSANYFTYHPTGLSGSNGTFTFCDERGDPAARALIIARTGRVRASRVGPDGSSLKC